MNRSNPIVTKEDLKQTERNIMSKLTDWAKQEQADLSGIKDLLTSIATLVAQQTTLIQQLQTSPGPISPDDQAALDSLQATTAQLKIQATAISPVVTPTPPTP